MGTNYEIWKDVVGYEGILPNFKWGRVKSISRTINNYVGSYISKEKILKQNLNKNNSRGAEKPVVAISINDNTTLLFKSINEAKKKQE